MSVVRKITDGFRNVVSGIGTAKDKSSYNSYYYRPLTQQEVEQLYFEDWIARKAVDLVPDDETREWRTWQTEDAQGLYDLEKRLQVRAKVNLARKWERLYGGAAILIGTGDPDPREPLDVSTIGRDGLQYLHVFSRHELQAEPEWVTDLADPDYGKPLLYRPILTRGNVQMVPIHRSRFVIFEGLDLPRVWREGNEGWGLPLYQHLRDAIFNAASTAGNVAALINEAKLDVIKVPDLEHQLSTPEGEARVIQRFTLASQLKSTINTLLLGTGEEFDRKQTTFAGLQDLMTAQLQTVAGALDMPVTRFLGTSPTGLAASGDMELRAYYDMIRARQTTDLSDALAPLDEALIRATFGTMPEGIDQEWAELWTPTPEERAKIEKLNSEIDTAYVNMGIFPDSDFAKAIRDKLIERGTYPTLDQHVPEDGLGFIVPEFNAPGGEGDDDEGA